MSLLQKHKQSRKDKGEQAAAVIPTTARDRCTSTELRLMHLLLTLARWPQLFLVPSMII